MQIAADCIMSSSASGKIRISVGLTAVDFDEFTALAENAHVSVSWLGERAISEFMERSRNGQASLPLVFGTQQKLGSA